MNTFKQLNIIYCQLVLLKKLPIDKRLWGEVLSFIVVGIIKKNELIILKKIYPQITSLKIMIESKNVYHPLKIIHKHLNLFSHLKHITFSNEFKLSDDCIAKLNSIKKLKEIIIIDCIYLTHEGYINISKINKLERLELIRCPFVNNLSVMGISKMNNLKHLNLSGCKKISNLGIPHLNGLHDIESFIIRGCEKISDRSFMFLMSSFKNIKKLDISGCTGLTSFGISTIKRLKNLQDLSLSGCNTIFDITLESFSSKIYNLDLSYCESINGSFVNLFNTSNIRNLNLKNCKKIEKIYQKYFPKIEILNLSGTNISNQNLSKEIIKMKYLKQLDLSNCNQISKDVIFKLLFSKIELIDVSNCDNINLSEILI